MTDDSRTTRRQTCRDCAALTSGDCGQHESHIRILRTRIVAEDSKLLRTVTIEAELLDDVARTLEGFAKTPFGKMAPCFCYLSDIGIVIGDERQVEHCGMCRNVFQVLARVRAAREGK